MESNVDLLSPHWYLVAVIEVHEEALAGLGSVVLPPHELRPATESPQGYAWLEIHVPHNGNLYLLTDTAKQILIALARAEEEGAISGLRIISGAHWLDDAPRVRASQRQTIAPESFTVSERRSG